MGDDLRAAGSDDTQKITKRGGMKQMKSYGRRMHLFLTGQRTSSMLGGDVVKTEIKTKRFSDGGIEYLDKPYEIVERPLWFHKQGLSETPSGYGGKLRSSRCVRFPDGTQRRIYITCYSNAGSAWIIVNKRRVHLLE
jgi:hypothetical protein